jgi:hypothetical protein
MHVIRKVDAFQGHPIPTRVTRPQGPFPAELFRQEPVNYDYDQAFPEDGSDFRLGATAQNGFNPPLWLRCYDCHARVREDETELHECEE